MDLEVFFRFVIYLLLGNWSGTRSTLVELIEFLAKLLEDTASKTAKKFMSSERRPKNVCNHNFNCDQLVILFFSLFFLVGVEKKLLEKKIRGKWGISFVED